jgi:hypothetical protein
MSAVSIEKKLHDKGVIFRQSGEWLPYCKYQDKGYHSFRTHVYPKSDGSEGSKRILVWNESGRAFVHQIMKGGVL